MLSPTTQANGTAAAMARSTIARARCGLVAKAISCGTGGGARRTRFSGQGLGKKKGPIDKGVPFVRDIGREYADLAVGDLARRAGVLPSHPAGCLALLQKTGLVNHQNGIIRRQVFE